MWLYDEKLVRSLLVSAISQWIVVLVLLAFLYIGGASWFSVILITLILVLLAVLETLQCFVYSRGIFVSDFELILPGLIKRRFKSEELEKIILPKCGSPQKRCWATFVFKKSSRSVMFSSPEKRQEVVGLISDFCPHVQLVDRSR